MGFSVSSQKPVKHERIDGVSTRKKLADAIAQKGGNGSGQAQVVEVQTQRIFGCSTKELYDATEANKGDRSTLPAEAQEAYQVSDTLTKHAIDKMPTPRGTQEQKNEKIVREADKVNRQLSGFFPWNW